MSLVIQPATAAQAAQAGRLAGAKSIEQEGTAFRLRGAAANPGVTAYCLGQKLDCAAVPDGLRFADLKLLAMDMDSTLITIECIDEMGDMAGKKGEIAAITAQAMRGEIQYPESLKRRVAILAGLPMEALQRVYDERLRLSPGAEQLLATCKRHGVKLLLVSGGFTFFTDKLKQRLGFDFTLSNELQIEAGKLTGGLLGSIVDAEAKAARFRELSRGVRREHTVAIGDGANDLLMMAEAGTSVAYRAKPVVKARASCALDHAGLDGVVHLFE